MKRNQFSRTRKLNYFFGFFLLVSIMGAFLISSCTEKDTTYKEKPISNDDITFRDGRLIFKDDKSFMDYQKWLFENQGNPQLIADKNKSYGLKSMTEYYHEGMKLDENDPKFTEYVEKYPSVFYKETYDNSTLYFLPHSKLLCYVANKDGIFQVGDKINRIVWNYVYEIADGDESKIELLFLSKDKISDKSIKISPSCSDDAKNDYGNRTRYFSNSKYRIVSSLKENVYAGIWYNDIQTNPQKRTWGVWLRSQLNTKSANGSGYKNALNCSGCPKLPIYASNTEKTGLSTHTISWGDLQLDMSDSYCPAYSRGRLNTQYIYVSWTDALDTTPSFTEPNWTPGVDEPF
jgi:hypothetical protein